jgi:hypothetical protein
VRTLAYRYTPLEEDVAGVVVDAAELRASPTIQVCLGCVGFYAGGEVIALEFAREAEAASYAKTFLDFELSKHIYRNRPMPRAEHGATLLDSSLAVRHAGRYFYIIGSWMPETIAAILRGVR